MVGPNYRVPTLMYGAVLLGVQTQWIVAGALVLLGLGIAMGVGKTRTKDVLHE